MNRPNQNQFISYQPIHPNQIPPNHPDMGYCDPRNKKTQPQPISDAEFFSSLQCYRTCCYMGSGTPIFLINDRWYAGMFCLMVANAIFALVIVAFLNGSSTGLNPISQADKHKFLIINLGVIFLINLTFLLTQFLNPGIRNLWSIPHEEYEQDGKVYCSKCDGYRTQEMDHCMECRVCVVGLDHHCGFFSKCIAGWQKFAFYAFLMMVFGGFIVLLATLTTYV